MTVKPAQFAIPSAAPNKATQRFAQLVSVGISDNDGSGFPTHRHDAGPELVAVLDGLYQLKVQAEVHALTPGSLLVVPRALPHQILAGSPWKSLYLLFEDAEPFPAHDVQIMAPEQTASIIGLMRNLHRLREEHWPDEALNALVNAILHLVKILLSTQDDPPLAPPVAKAMAWLEADITRSFDAETVARISGISLSGLNRLFRQQTGYSPLGFLTHRRMQRARQLLRDPYLSIQEVADQCGFDDANYFIRRFRSHHGVPPRRWSRK